MFIYLNKMLLQELPNLSSWCGLANLCLK